MLISKSYVRNKVVLCLYTLIVRWLESATKLDSWEGSVSIGYSHPQLRSSVCRINNNNIGITVRLILKRKWYIVKGWMDGCLRWEEPQSLLNESTCSGLCSCCDSTIY